MLSNVHDAPLRAGGAGNRQPKLRSTERSEACPPTTPWWRRAMRRGDRSSPSRSGWAARPWSNRGKTRQGVNPPSGWREVTLSGDAERGESNFAALAVDTLCEAEMREARREQHLAVLGSIQPLLHQKSNVAGGRFSATAAAAGRDDRDRLPAAAPAPARNRGSLYRAAQTPYRSKRLATAHASALYLG